MFILPVWHFQIGQLASYISSKLETNSAKFCLTILGWSTDTVYLPMKNAAFCVRNVDFYWCNPCVYELAFISLWCSQNCSFSSFTFLWYILFHFDPCMIHITFLHLFIHCCCCCILKVWWYSILWFKPECQPNAGKSASAPRLLVRHIL